MEKTKLGISVSLAAALLYFLGLINTTALIIAVGYVLIVEKEQWLRKAAVQSLTIVIGYQLVSSLLGLGSRFFSFVNDIITNIFYSFHIGYPLHMDDILLNLVWILQAVLLLILGFMALANKRFNLPLIGDFTDKHLGLPRQIKAIPQQQSPYGQPGYPVQQAPVYPQQPYAAPQTQPTAAVTAQPVQSPYTDSQNQTPPSN